MDDEYTIWSGPHGWAQVSWPDPPGNVFVRVSPDAAGRLVIREFHMVLDSDAYVVTARTLRDVALGEIEARLNAPAAAGVIRDRLAATSPADFARRLLELNDHEGQAPSVDAFVRELGPSRRAEEGKAQRRRRRREAPAVQRPADRDGYDDAFYAAVAARYLWLVEQRLRAPAPQIAQEAGAPVSAVHRWIATARRRGNLPPAAKGRVG